MVCKLMWVVAQHEGLIPAQGRALLLSLHVLSVFLGAPVPVSVELS